MNNTIHRNDFEDIDGRFQNGEARRLLSYYSNYRKDIVEKDTDLFLMKKKYDEASTIEAKMHRQKLLQKIKIAILLLQDGDFFISIKLSYAGSKTKALAMVLRP